MSGQFIIIFDVKGNGSIDVVAEPFNHHYAKIFFSRRKAEDYIECHNVRDCQIVELDIVRWKLKNNKGEQK